MIFSDCVPGEPIINNCKDDFFVTCLHDIFVNYLATHPILLSYNLIG